MTRKLVPTEIVKLLTGQEDTLAQFPDRIIAILDEELLTDCLKVYSGKPQPLWWLGYHHTTEHPWEDIIAELVKQPEHRCFLLALNEVLSHLLCGGGDKKYSDFSSVWGNICELGQPVRHILFERLLAHAVEINGSRSSSYWQRLFQSTEEDELKEYVQRILPFIERISTNHDNLFKLFGKDVFGRYFMPHLPGDLKVFHILAPHLNQIEQLSVEDKQEILNEISNVFQKTPPRMYRTIKIVEDVLVEMQPLEDMEINNLVKTTRSALVNQSSKQAEYQECEERLPGWQSKYQ